MNAAAPGIIDYEDGVTAIDVEFHASSFAASHLIVDHGRAALVDCGTNFSVPRILAALAHKSVSPAAVDYLILTHVHLDHAGGAGLLMQALPNATLLVHPRGARHMVDPRILYASATQVYGEAEMTRTYGQLIPVGAGRVRAMNEGDTVRLGQRDLYFIDTQGHARHHLCIVDPVSNGVFTGDSFGVSYRETDIGGSPFIMPTTTPPQFDPDAAHASVSRIAAFGTRWVYLTHFGRIGDVPRLASDLHACLDAYVELALGLRHAGEGRHHLLSEAMASMLYGRMQAQGTTLPQQAALAPLKMDIALNAQGLEVWLDSLPS